MVTWMDAWLKLKKAAWRRFARSVFFFLIFVRFWISRELFHKFVDKQTGSSVTTSLGMWPMAWRVERVASQDPWQSTLASLTTSMQRCITGLNDYFFIVIHWFNSQYIVWKNFYTLCRLQVSMIEGPDEAKPWKPSGVFSLLTSHQKQQTSSPVIDSKHHGQTWSHTVANSDSYELLWHITHTQEIQPKQRIMLNAKNLFCVINIFLHFVWLTAVFSWLCCTAVLEQRKKKLTPIQPLFQWQQILTKCYRPWESK